MTEHTPRSAQQETSIDVEQEAIRQLSQIFPAVEAEKHLSSKTAPSMLVDAVAHSSNGRLVLFEIKQASPGRRLTYSVYPPLAALKQSVASISPEAPPILVLLTTSDVDESVMDILAQVGIPVVILGKNVADTKRCLQESLRPFAIELPELADGEMQPVAVAGLCYVSIRYRPEYETVFNKAIKPAIQQAGYQVVRPDNASYSGSILEKTRELLQRCDVVVAEVSQNASQNALLEIGMAIGFGKRILVISQSTETLPTDFRDLQVLIYQNSLQGIERLGSLLTEWLVLTRRQQEMKR